ncbi:uncharacterized protein LOC134215543 [Armigeres subalbatus]|uniref:uncharacterized protein LOC134215543 n=1 Tax=Armigeres subalbatus TaxID=124917 RepID=UPI002ED44779
MKKLVALIGFFVLLSAVNAQRRRNVTLLAVTTEQPANNANSEATSASSVVTTEENAQAVEVLRRGIERRRLERLQRIEQRRATILQNLENMSDRRREFELRRQERLRTAQELIEDRRQEMEARRAGRIPIKEQDRVLRLRQQRLGQNTPDNEQNEVDGPRELLPAVADLVRRIVLIEEANGNVRLIDIDTDEGRDLISRVMERVETEEEKAEAIQKLKVKLGQL